MRGSCLALHRPARRSSRRFEATGDTVLTARSLHLEIAATDARLAELAPAWTALGARVDGSAFQSHGWVAAWWGALPAGRRPALRLVLAWRDGNLVGVMALAVRRYRGLRVLEWAAKDVTDYCDALVDAGEVRAGTVAAMWAAVAGAGGWDVAYLSHLAPGSGIGEVADASLPARVPFRPGRRTATSLYVPAPPGSTRAWFDTLPKKSRQSHRRAVKALAEMGIETRFRVVGPHEPMEVPVRRLIEFKTAWLRRTGRPSPLLADGGALFGNLVEALARAGALRLFVLEAADGRLLAGSVNFVEHGRLLVFFSAYDPAYERGSVGMVTFVEGIRWTFEQGLREFDFLCGDEEYKRRLGGRPVTLRSVVAARTLLGRVALAIETAARAIRARRARPAAATASAAPAPTAARPGTVPAAPAGPIRLPGTL